MLTRCIFCQREFPANNRLEHLPAGTRLAFDPQRGRLWSICGACQNWTLQPFEQRWEALEELERVTTDRAKLLVQGENIALFRAGELELLRIGNAGLPEEAWWRYGDELARRRDRAGRIARRGKIIDALVTMAVVGVPIWYGSDPAPWIEGARRKAFGETAWKGVALCRKCGQPGTDLRFRQSLAVQVLGPLHDVSLRLPCECGPDGGVELVGESAAHTLRRLLAWHNFKGASQTDVVHAAGQIERDSDGELLTRLFSNDRALGALPAVNALTLEIALNHDRERALLQLEVAELQARWLEEERIAAIADRELT